MSDTELIEKPITVFISYSWDDESHQLWVLNLAERLSANGVHVLFDRYDITVGKEMTHFMENFVSQADKVLLIMTPKYKEKADDRKGGVGYEYSMITQEFYEKESDQKFIPILRKGSFNESAPVGKPIKKTIKYIDRKGDEHKVLFDFMQIKNMDKIKIFLTIKNANIQTIASGFEYDATWLSPKIGGWFVYISSDSLSSDMYRNVDLDGLDESVKHYKDFVKTQLNDFFKEKNQEYDNFTDKLKKDEFYPYKEKTSSQSKVILFDKLAYLVEDKYNILGEQNKLREIVYPLIDRTISNGHLDNILRSILKLNNKMLSKFSELLDKTELENIIEFSDKVAGKLEDLDFLEKLVYSEISKNVKERKELHKFLEKMLWIFGEEYNDSTRLLSDKNLEKNLLELRGKFLKYKGSKSDDNISQIKGRSINSITDLFLYSEKIIDLNKREVLIVELKSPKVKISPKELGQVMKYAQEIQEMGVFPDRLNYKILLVSSDINKSAKFYIEGNQKGQENPYFYFKNEQGNVEVWVIKWSAIIENVKRKLKYMSNILETKDVDVQEKAKRDFAGIDFGKTSSTLKKVAV